MNTILIVLGLLILVFISFVIYLRLPKFGKNPKGERLKRVLNSPNYKNGAFQNKIKVPQFTNGGNFFKALMEFLFAGERLRPGEPVPSLKTDLKKLSPAENVLVWLGHSSYFIQLEGKKILVDPVLSGNASPVPNQNKAFKGSDPYDCKDLPEIDFLLLTHDHWDHLDYKAICNLKQKTGKIICPLGVGETLEHWGIMGEKIIEKDWDKKIDLAPGFTVHTVPSQHFSGRGLKRNKTLWTAYVLEAAGQRIFMGGDSGYESHFTEIGDQFGPFDLAILECGQYHKYWRCIHMFPEDTLQAGKDLKAKNLLPVHSGKFVLSNHPWDEPYKRLVALKNNDHPHLLFPLIGQKLDLKDIPEAFPNWWENVT